MLKRLLACFTALLLPATLLAEPVPISERGPVDIRRTTFVVRDIEKSLPLYRDALGLKVIYDQLIGGGTDAAGKAIAPTLRLVLLRANDSFIGALGLMQRLNQVAVPAPAYARASVGPSILVINVADLGKRWASIEATPHIKVDSKPIRVEYPSPAGGVIPVMFSSVWDADGNFIELNQLLGAPASMPAN